ncbi:MAG: amidohydrolase [Pseudomonadota bacterium]|nr:amidohydrolase [Pseudomonadota bacterium]
MNMPGSIDPQGRGASQHALSGIDVHAHVVPEAFPAYAGRNMPAQWPSTALAHACHRHVMISGKNYRTVSDLCWDASKRLSGIDELRIDRQVLSPMPELLSYWLEPNDAASLLRHINEQIAEMVAVSHGRFLGLGAVPLPDIDLALRELEHVMHTLGFAGVELGSNINGVPIGDPRFDAFFEACEDIGAAVFVHALRPAGMDRLVGPPMLQQVLAYPTDVGLAAASVLTSNLIVRRPRLRIAFSHGGGTLGLLLPRLERSRSVFPALRDTLQVTPLEQARKLYYDTLVFDTSTLKHLVALFGASQMMIGTDYPFNFHDAAPVTSIQAAGFDPQVVQQLLRSNAERFLGLRAHGEP